MYIRQASVLIFCVLLGVSGVQAAPAVDAGAVNKAPTDGAVKKAPASEPTVLDYIAIVNGERISMGEYVSTLRRGLRERFYHGKIPEEEGKKFRKEVADGLVEKVLLAQEAKRRKLQPDAAAVDLSVDAFDAKYQDNPDWKKARETVLPQVREKLENDSLAKLLEESVHKVEAPAADELKRFYEKNTDLFTTPERVKVSLILLRVDPSATSEVWKRASDEAATILERINAGGDFAELARIHSSDESAQNGGDMGFVHSGMLGEVAQKVLDIMEVGEMSSPVVMLEGVSILRLDERDKPRLNSFDAVKERAEQLYMRDKGEELWKKLLAGLRKTATVEMNEAPWQ